MSELKTSKGSVLTANTLQLHRQNKHFINYQVSMFKGYSDKSKKYTTERDKQEPSPLLEWV